MNGLIARLRSGSFNRRKWARLGSSYWGADSLAAAHARDSHLNSLRMSGY